VNAFCRFIKELAPSASEDSEWGARQVLAHLPDFILGPN
jgi:hypothetical protein